MCYLSTTPVETHTTTIHPPTHLHRMEFGPEAANALNRGDRQTVKRTQWCETRIHAPVTSQEKETFKENIQPVCFVKKKYIKNVYT